MTRALLAVLLWLPACVSISEQPVRWKLVCPQQETYGSIVTDGRYVTSHTSRCSPRARISVPEIEKIRHNFTIPRVENVFYADGRMIWFNPERPDYALVSQYLHRAIYPFDTLEVCQAAGVCVPTDDQT